MSEISNHTAVYPMIVTYRYRWMRILNRYAAIVIYVNHPFIPEDEVREMVAEKTGHKGITITGTGYW